MKDSARHIFFQDYVGGGWMKWEQLLPRTGPNCPFRLGFSGHGERVIRLIPVGLVVITMPSGKRLYN